MPYISRLKLTNWRNFRSVDFPMQPRMFLVGPNASGKSNVLDALRFLKDLCTTGGGLQPAVQGRRGGLSKIRSLFAHGPSEVAVGCEVRDEADPAS
jgi:predicted ATPase